MVSLVALIIVSAVLALIIGWFLKFWIPVLIRLLRCRSIPALPNDRILGGHMKIYCPGKTTVVDRVRIFESANSRVVRVNFGFGLPAWIALVHPEQVASVYNTNTEARGDNFPTSSLKPLLGKSLMLSGGARWRRSRNLLRTAFGRNEVRRFVKTFGVLAEELVDHWTKLLQSQGVVTEKTPLASPPRSNLHQLNLVVDNFFSKLTLESILRTAFAVKTDDWIYAEQAYGVLIDSFFEAHMTRFSGNPLKLWDLFYFTLSGQGRKLKKICEETRAYARDIIRGHRKKIAEDDSSEKKKSSERWSMVDIMLRARDPESGEGMSEEELVDQCNLFLVAGYDTTRLTMTWLFYLLAKHPDEQHRCREEVDMMFNGKEVLAWEDLSEMRYTTWCIKETLRLYPPASNTLRVLPKDTEVGGFMIPAGMQVSANAEVLHRSGDYWEKPHDFYPEHFRPEAEESRHPNAFIPFITGPRRCLGEMFAMQELKVVAAHLLHRFVFVLDPHHVVRDTKRGLLTPENGVKLIMRLRNDLP